MQNTVHIATFNVWTLNRISQFPKLTASAPEHNINSVWIHEHRYSHSEQEPIYHDTDNGWKFVSASAWKKIINGVVGVVGILLCPRAQKSQKSIEKILPMMMCALFNSNFCTSLIICYSPSNNKWWNGYLHLQWQAIFLCWCISKYYVLIIGGDMNAQIVKEKKKPMLKRLFRQMRTIK